MVEAELCFFEVEIEGVPGHATEPCESSFGQAPEALDAVDVVSLSGELVLPVLATHAARTEVRFIGLKHAFQQRLPLALGCDLPAHAQEDRVHRTNGNACQLSRLRRRQIQRKTTNQMAKSNLTQLRIPKITIYPRHHCTLAPL